MIFTVFTNRKGTNLIFALLVLIPAHQFSAQTAGSGFTIVQEIEVGSATTGGINDLLTGVDLDSDGNGEIIVQVGLSTDAKAIIYEWDGVDSYDQIWSVSLTASNASTDNIGRFIGVYDTDNDGNLELFVANSAGSGDNRIFCYEMSGGALSSTNPSTTSKGPNGGGAYFSATTQIRAIVLGNSDEDSYGELYVGNSGNSNSIEVWEADGNDSWYKVSLSEASVGDGIIDMAPPVDLDGDNDSDDIAVCEQQGKLTVIDFSTLGDPIKKTVNNANDTGNNTEGRVITYNLDNSGNPEIIISNNFDDGIFVFEYNSGSSDYNRDKTDAVLLSIGADINSIGAQDFDSDGKGEIYFTYNDSVRYFEFNSTSGDFDASSDFATSADLIAGTSNNTYVVQPSMNSGNKLLDGDQLRDFIIGTDGNGNSGRGEIFIVESQTTDSSLPVELTFWSAKSEEEKVILKWVTESEIENIGFILYKGMQGDPLVKLTDYRFEEKLRGQGSTSFRTQYQFIDEDVKTGNTYQYRLSDISYNGVERNHGKRTVKVRLKGVIWLPAFPNPFNPNTQVMIQVGSKADISLKVYNIIGNEICTIVSDILPSGEYYYQWNGKSSNGNSVANGVYFLELTSEDSRYLQKVILLR